MSNHINEILFALTDAEVEFIVAGGVAAVLHGVERVTLISILRWIWSRQTSRNFYRSCTNSGCNLECLFSRAT